MAEPIAKAHFGLADLKETQKMKPGSSFAVHFNPSSLQYTVKNTIKEGSGKSTQQYVSQTSGQLSLELIFDTTGTGADVRIHTGKIVGFMKPEPKTKAPPVVQFEWGTFMFRGLVDTYKETIDFFAPNGVPLRAAVSITLASQDKVFGTASAQQDRDADVQVPGGPGLDPARTASLAGNPGAGRAIAARNNQESLRFSKGPLTVSADVKLNGPAAFASGSAGAGFGIGGGASAGIGLGGGAGIGLSGGAGIQGAAGINLQGGVSGAGSSGSFGIAASEGAFANLRTELDLPREIKLDTGALLPSPPVPGIATDSGAAFSLGGKATLEGSASLSADVGASATLRGRIQFDP